ncbi:hypothetical protein L873DRAFT_1762382 [Choiromyces venosus 120613-1]|uniref:Fork-head domain-containing protein n=1 Tax=Choiromyces venosus 120613-1 TaxID=1336337 RepID=A0A3N4K0F6_9PEZI|nr:hypothetical protein L873DRAFT_1762382 [Choiromyces venosus 120613-1]
MESRSFSPTDLDAPPRLDANTDVKEDTSAFRAPLAGMELDDDKAIQQVDPVGVEVVSGVSEANDDNNNLPAEQLEEETGKKKEEEKVEEDVPSRMEEEVSPVSAPIETSTVANNVIADTMTTAAADEIAAPTAPSALMTTPPPRPLRSPDMSERLPVSLPQLSTPQQQVENMRRVAGACRPLIFNGMSLPSPIVEPGALHELGDPTSPNGRRSSANSGIAGLNELRLDKINQLIHATGFDDASGNNREPEYEHTIDAFIKLNFDDGNVYYVKNSSVIFGRMEGATSNTFQQIGPDGSTVIGGGNGFGFEHPTTPGAMGMKREKKKRRKKKDGVGSKKSKSTTSGGSSAAPVTSRRGSAFQGQPQFPLFRDPFGFQYGNHNNHFTQEDETPMIYLPPPNPSGEQEVASAAPPKKNISRKHAKLAYNAARGWFELDIMGKNGAFVNEEFVQVGTKLIIDPKEGTKVQIGGVSFVVYVPEHLEGGPEAIEPPTASGGMGKGKGRKGKSTKGKMPFSFSDDNDIESELSDLDVAMGDGDEGSVNGSGDSRENESGEESDRDSDEEGENREEEDEGGEDDEGEEGDVENSEEMEDSGEEGEEDSPSPEPAKVEKRGRGRPRKDQTEARRKELAKEKAAAERAKAKEKEKERRQREKLEAQRRERELGKEREKKRLEAQRQKEDRQRQKERLQKEKEKKKLHLPVSAKDKREEAKKEKKLYLPPLLSAKSEKPSAPTQERKGPGRPPKEKKPEVQTQAPLQPLLPQQPPAPTHQPQPQPEAQEQPQEQPQEEKIENPPDDTEMYHSSYHDDLQNLAPLRAANLAMSMPIDPALSHDYPQTQPAPIVYQEASKEPKKEKLKKEKPPSKRKRAPSPEINEADFPPEALLKPSASYVVLIHEAISSSERGALTLPEIYKAIERKYPYYKVKVTTNGWQSSVRHNLGQHKAFYKVERSGKGWLWSCTKGVSIEKEKKGSAATRSTNSASYASGISNGHRNVQNGRTPLVQYYNSVQSPHIPQPPQYLPYLQSQQQQQPQYQQAPPASSALPVPRPPPAYHAPIPSAASLKQQQHMPPPHQQPPANVQSGGHNPDYNAAILGLQGLIQQHKDTPGPHSSELLKMATEVLRSLIDKDPGAMEAIKKLTAIIKQIDQAKAATHSPAPQHQYQQQHGQIQSGKNEAVAASAVDITATTPIPAVVAQPARQNSVVGGAPVAAALHANKPPPINIKDLSPEEKAVLVKRLLLAKKQKEQAAAAAAAAAANKVSSASPSVAVSTPAPVTPALTQAPPLHPSPLVARPAPAPIPSPTPADSALGSTTPTSTKRPREPEPEDSEAKRQNTG